MLGVDILMRRPLITLSPREIPVSTNHRTSFIANARRVLVGSIESLFLNGMEGRGWGGRCHI